MQRLCFSLAGGFGLVGVALAAVGAHLPLNAPEMVRSVAMLLGWHAPTLIALGVWNRRQGFLVASVLAVGMVLFAGAVLYRAFTGISLGPVAPTGGTILMAGWALLAVVAWRK